MPHGVVEIFGAVAPGLCGIEATEQSNVEGRGR